MLTNALLDFELSQIDAARQLLRETSASFSRDVLASTERAYLDWYRHTIAEQEEDGEPLELIFEASGLHSNYKVLVIAMRYIEGNLLRAALAALEHPFQTPIERSRALDRVALSASRLRQTLLDPVLQLAGLRVRPRSLGTLPPDWVGTLQRHASPEVLLALRIMSLTGCRPVEIGRGFDFELGGAADARLSLAFVNAKRRCGDKPTRRRFTFVRGQQDALLDATVAMLEQRLGQAGADLFGARTGRICVKRPGSRICNLAAKLWPDASNRPSGYHLRYAFRTGLKHHDQTLAAISSAMGHGTGASQSSYGRGAWHPRTNPRQLALCIAARIEPRQEQVLQPIGAESQPKARQRLRARPLEQELDLELER